MSRKRAKTRTHQPPATLPATLSNLLRLAGEPTWRPHPKQAEFMTSSEVVTGVYYRRR